MSGLAAAIFGLLDHLQLSDPGVSPAQKTLERHAADL
jgi:hypothetical protein